MDEVKRLAADLRAVALSRPDDAAYLIPIAEAMEASLASGKFLLAMLLAHAVAIEVKGRGAEGLVALCQVLEGQATQPVITLPAVPVRPIPEPSPN